MHLSEKKVDSGLTNEARTPLLFDSASKIITVNSKSNAQGRAVGVKRRCMVQGLPASCLSGCAGGAAPQLLLRHCGPPSCGINQIVHQVELPCPPFWACFGHLLCFKAAVAEALWASPSRPCFDGIDILSVIVFFLDPLVQRLPFGRKLSCRLVYRSSDIVSPPFHLTILQIRLCMTPSTT